MSKLLYVSKRARVNIDLTIAFLCTRVSKSTDEDWNKLRRLLKYLNVTIYMPRILVANGLEILQTWVDASYVTHQYMRGHTDAAMSTGVGLAHNKSGKQKLNTKSSIKSEVVGACDYMSWMIWAKRFLT